MSLFTPGNSIKIVFNPLPAENGNGRQPSCSIGTLFSVIEEAFDCSLENLLGESTQFNIQKLFCLPTCDRLPFRQYLLERSRILLWLLLEIFCSSFWSLCQVLVEADGEV